jgi:dihydrofolate synthase / folylpolyglutamate synthase
MERFLGRLGNPRRHLRFIHVAGTNGKGSVAATLLNVLSQAGYRVGLYTSPHLSCVRERFRINGNYISEESFARHATAIHDVLAGEQITYFEFTTALALLWFAAEKVDVAIMEVGMGGRLDATNVITPMVGVITNVSLDHQAYLGDTLAEVAVEKAGIIKPGVPLVSGVAADDSRQVVTERCRELAAPLYLLGRDFFWQAGSASAGSWDYRGLHGTIKDLHSRLRGHYQRDNLSLALATLEILAERLPVREEDIRTGLATVSWPGRLELLELTWAEPSRGPLSKLGEKRRVLLDGAHNPAGVAALAATLAGDEFRRRRLVMIWASMADKDVAAGLSLIAPLCDILILTRPESERSATPEAMRRLLPPSTAEILDAPDPAAALNLAWQLSEPEDLIVVAGSLYLVGAVRQLLVGELVG